MAPGKSGVHAHGEGVVKTSHTAVSHSKDGETSCGEELQSIEAIFAIYLHLFSSYNFLPERGADGRVGGPGAARAEL